MAINFTNAEVRSILNGLGLGSRVFSSDYEAQQRSADR
jgi:hypothetical protein